LPQNILLLNSLHASKIHLKQYPFNVQYFTVYYIGIV